MITSILEFFFSNHYLYDSDNRFNTRIKNAKTLNRLANHSLGEKRLKKALYYFGLDVLDKISSPAQPMAVVFGNIYFKENGKLTPANIEIDNGITGNVYVAIVDNQTVVTLKLFPLAASNQDIIDDIEKHDGKKLKQLRDMDGTVLSPNDKKRKTIIIDLDINDAEFLTLYPAPVLKNNKYTKNGGGLSQADIEQIEADKKNAPEKLTFTMNVIPTDMTALIPNKEFVIYKGMDIWVPYAEGPKKKKIRDVIVDEKGEKRKFMLEFENTMRPMSLEIGTQFIISPDLKNEVYKKLIDAFGLDDDQQLNFQGPITTFNFYKKGKGGSDRNKLGVIISPRNFFQ